MKKSMVILRVVLPMMLLLSVGIIAGAQADYTPIFEPGACPTDMPTNVDYECGIVVVPEDRANPDAGDVRLQVAILRHPERAHDDPIIYLEGGPGGSTFAQLSLAYGLIFRDIHLASGRDLIVFDQRGVGQSSPQLTCPEVNRMALNTLDYRYQGEDLTASGVSELIAQATVECGERLQGEVNLAMYTTSENARDVNDIRIALDYDQVNLWGISYGSKLALIAMRQHPEAIRSALIDAILPPQLDFIATLPGYVDRAFNVLFDRCEADSACNEAYPNLRDVFWNLYERLEAEPLRLNTINPSTAQPVRDVVFDGVGLTSYLFTLLYQTDVLPYLPQFIYALDAGDYRTAEVFIQISLQQLELVTLGMNVTFQCQDEIPFVDVELAREQFEAFSRLGLEYSLTGLLALEYCDAFAMGDVDPSANEAVVSDIPTLIMSGEFDPITPPINGVIASETLPNSYVYEFIGTGHGASFSDDCPVSMSVAFFNDPSQAPDASCMDAIDKPQFATPDTPLPEVTLIEAQLTNGATYLQPEGWLEVPAEGLTGVFSRQIHPLDQGALLILSDLPLGQDVFVLTFAAGIGAPPPQAEATLSLDSGDWTLYGLEFQGYPAYLMATRDARGLQVFVIVANDEDDRQHLYDNLLLPSLEAYRYEG